VVRQTGHRSSRTCSIGSIRHKGEIYRGEQAPILDPKLWRHVQDVLAQNGISGGPKAGNRYGATLKGILHCASCGAAVLHTFTVRRSRRYRYYVCLTAQQRGWKACATKSVNAQNIEQSILERVRGLAADPDLAAETCRRVQEQQRNRTSELRTAIEHSVRNADDLRKPEDQRRTWSEFNHRHLVSL
jgi:site-specific DNA recombinase